MKIFVSHSTGFDYIELLYKPLKEFFNENAIGFILPEEKQSNSKQAISSCDIFIAEVSYPSTGSGIEIGWADMLNKPIYFIYITGSKPSSALKYVSDKFIEYDDIEDLKVKLKNLLHTLI